MDLQKCWLAGSFHGIPGLCRRLGAGAASARPFSFALIVFLFEATSLADGAPQQIATFLEGVRAIVDPPWCMSFASTLCLCVQSEGGIQGISPGMDTEVYVSRKRGQLRLLNAGEISVNL